VLAIGSAWLFVVGSCWLSAVSFDGFFGWVLAIGCNRLLAVGFNW
jgi:hypothetical protein